MRKKKNASAGLKLKKDISAYIILLPAVFCLFMFVWRPIYSGTIMSFYKMKGYEPVSFVGFDNYRAVITESVFRTTLTNTFKYVIYSLVIGFLPPIFVAIMVNELRVAKTFVKFSIYFPAICPVIITSLLWALLYDPSAGGMLNTLLLKTGMSSYQWLDDPKRTILLIIISMTWAGFGSTAILYLATLQGIPRELYEAAYMDGAGFWKRVWHITLPQISSIILLLFVKQIVGVFQVFTEPLAMTGGGPNNASVTLSLLGYRYGFVYFKIEKALAVGVITFAILFVLTIFYFIVEKRVATDE